LKIMSNFDNSLNKLLDDAAEHLNAGRKDAAREVLQQALNLDRNNLATWELLWRAAYNLEEELFSLKRILRIDPKHGAAKQRLAALQPAGATRSISQPLAQPTSQRPASRSRKRQQGGILLLLLGALLSVVCVSIIGLALFRGGYIPFVFTSNLTATAMAERNASCQALIDRTIQASDNYCDDTNSNTACYGNNTLKAELAPNAAQRFSERGDIIAVTDLRRLSASPLNLENNEWGIAVFKVVANLPRSLPGETVTMVVFGNATLENQSGESDNLESFYFSSELGQIICEKIPFDGLMITSPDGGGVRFAINGTELTLMGNASIKAVRNGEMEVSVYKGSARLVSNGQEQYVGAGQSSTVQLGGENGTQSISAPSEPEPLTGEELTMACTMTGSYCSPGEVTPVSEQQAQNEIQSAITSTPTPVFTPTITRTPSPTEPPTYTVVVLPSATPSKTQTRPPTLTRTPTRTPAPTSTNTPTQTYTPTATLTFTPTNTVPPTLTPVAPVQPICGTVFLSPLVNPNPNELSMDINNTSGSSITINRIFAYWVKLPTSQKMDRILLNGAVIWNKSDPDSPSDIPTEGNWIGGANLIVPAAPMSNLSIRFSDDLQTTGYEVHITFDIGCQVIGTK
jgi:hypothetical protein